MQAARQIENLSVDRADTFEIEYKAFEPLRFVGEKELIKHLFHGFGLGVMNHVVRCLVFQLKVLCVLKKNPRQSYEVDQNRQQHDQRSGQNGHQKLHNVFPFEGLAFVCE